MQKFSCVFSNPGPKEDVLLRAGASQDQLLDPSSEALAEEDETFVNRAWRELETGCRA